MTTDHKQGTDASTAVREFHAVKLPEASHLAWEARVLLHELDKLGVPKSDSEDFYTLWGRVKFALAAAAPADAGESRVPVEKPAYWQWRRRGNPWSQEYIFSHQVFATCEGDEVRALFAATLPPEPAPTAPLPAAEEVGRWKAFARHCQRLVGLIQSRLTPEQEVAWLDERLRDSISRFASQDQSDLDPELLKLIEDWDLAATLPPGEPKP